MRKDKSRKVGGKDKNMASDPAASIHKRGGHVAVSWQDLIIVWGGLQWRYDKDPSWVLIHFNGEWISKATVGEPPQYSFKFATAQVLDGQMYIMFGTHEPTNIIHSLDLNFWEWKRHHPEGNPPTTACKLSSWVHGKRIYCFGGMSHEGIPTNEFFCYNVAKNSWEWPLTNGNTVPSPRARHTTVAFEEHVLLFGGETNSHKFNDLHILEMNSMEWRMVHGFMGGWAVPEPRSGNTMTKISSTSARVRPIVIFWLLGRYLIPGI